MSKISRKERMKLKRKERKKKQKENKALFQQKQQEILERAKEPLPEVEIEYVITDPMEQVQLSENDPLYDRMKSIFDHFQPDDEDEEVNEVKEVEEPEPDLEKKRLSNKKKKLLKRLPIAVLKQMVDTPDLVELHDTSSRDPLLLVYTKSYRNAVPVPAHWSQKRKYLQGKRGIEKGPFELPPFIAATGIMELRNPGSEHKSLKAQMRERLNPTLGKIDIDYQVLHDAFFIHQTKPKLTIHGDLYYEGKEYEVEMREKRPGVLSKELRVALGMPEGAPPPWLGNMQKLGPPPSYPKLKIPGLTAPAPADGDYGGFGYAREENFMYASNHWGAVAQDSVPEMEVVQSEEESSDSGSEMDTETTVEEDSGIETPLWSQKY
eukprot:TRINITY_DN8222_c0_g1_i1.p1 TRINITY_DN8222_c0_g1~~TRINITY_DN8222_c0_g1_i1.p1  ORF type:complete len:378 (+),score=125.36 TRINITY_DN8222_c0_g1_i1:38-1171(+)